MENKIVRVGVGLYILNETNQVLLGLRKSNFAPDTWCPPGGHLEFMEDFSTCAAREAYEESGLLIEHDDIHYMALTNDKYPSNERHYITIHMVTSKYQGEVKLMEPEKCVKWQWFDLDNLPTPLLQSNKNFFDDKTNVAILQQFISQKN